MREWRAAAHALYATSTRTLPDFINGQALKVASEALKLTHRANQQRVEQQLGQVAREVRLKKGNRWKGSRWKQGKRVLREDSLAARILGKRFHETGRWGVKGNTMDEKAAYLIASRMRSANFIRSGWIASIRHLSAFVKRRPSGVSSGGVRQRGRLKGYASAARQGWKPIALIANTAMNTFPKVPSRKGNPQRVGEQGLSIAMRSATADMRGELARRLQPEFNRVAGRRRI